MANPIKETPVLKGQDAKNFLTEIKSSENVRIAQSERERIKESYDALKNLWKDKK
ncbi:MAG: hypothetical protein ACXVPN_04085 [Bacteroidia bacterium]